MKGPIKVDICYPKFNDENNIDNIKTLDKSRANDLDFFMDINEIGINLADNEYGLFIDKMRYIDKPEYISVGNMITNLDKAEYFSYDNIKKNYNKLGAFKEFDFDKYYRNANRDCDMYTVNVYLDTPRDTPVLIRTDEEVLHIPYDIFILLTVLTIECVECNKVLHYELIPNIHSDIRYVLLRFKLANKILKNKGILRTAVEPYLCIDGTKRKI